MIGSGVDVNARDGQGSTPLYYAAGWGDMLDVVKALVDHGADVNGRCIGSFTPLHRASESGGPAEADFLLGKGADVNARDDSGSTPLHVAASRHGPASEPSDVRRRLLELLIARGADVNAKDNEGKTPLHLALEGHHFAAAELLAEKGGKPGNDLRPSTQPAVLRSSSGGN